MTARAVVPLMAAAAVAWLALVVLSPVLPAPLAALVYAAGGFICHQRPERSFHWHGAQLAVCARCTGIYAGACALVLFAPLPPPAYAAWTRSRVRTGWLMAVAAAPTAVTVAAEWAGWWYPSALLRAATGVLLGVTGALVLTAALKARPADPAALKAPSEDTALH
jgi:uncharacterized membrane protein